MFTFTGKRSKKHKSNWVDIEEDNYKYGSHKHNYYVAHMIRLKKSGHIGKSQNPKKSYSIIHIGSKYKYKWVEPHSNQYIERHNIFNYENEPEEKIEKADLSQIFKQLIHKNDHVNRN